jgi:hypothetical protein
MLAMTRRSEALSLMFDLVVASIAPILLESTDTTNDDGSVMTVSSTQPIYATRPERPRLRT